MSVQIVTGYTGERHITPYMDATVNRGIFGEDGCILSSGSQMSASMPDINTFVIADGAFSIQGHIGITNGETLTVDTCASGSRRIDLVVARYEHNVDTLVDTMNIVLLKGTETTSQYPTTPTYRTGSIADGANVDLPLYRINLDGSTVTFTSLVKVSGTTMDATLSSATKTAWANIVGSTEDITDKALGYLGGKLLRLGYFTRQYTLSAGAYVVITYNMFGISIPFGYTPIGIVGYDAGDSNVCITCCRYNGTGNSVVVAIKNYTSATKTGTCRITVLFARTGIV